MKRNSVPVVSFFTGALFLFTGLFPAQPVSAAWSAAVWNVNCPLTHTGPDDPIVYPGQPGKSHMHSFYGNTTTNAASTTATLLASPSSCGKGLANTDHSAYWIPSIYQKQSGGAMLLDTGTPGQQAITVYYRRPSQAAGPKIQAFPAGLRMIAGDKNATSPQPTSVTEWNCGSGNNASSSIPTCTGNSFLHAAVHFPSCWDGQHLDSADHKSHMAYAGRRGACPADHPVPLPAVTFSISYHNIQGGPQYELSSGGQYSMHGDFFAAWDSRAQNALVSACLNAARDCTSVHRTGDTLTKGSTTISLADFKASPQVLSDQTVAAPAPSAAPAAVTPLPQTGAGGLTLGVLGLAGIGYLYYDLRMRRRSLRKVLLRSGRPT